MADENKLQETIAAYNSHAGDYVERNKKNHWWIGPNQFMDKFAGYVSPPAQVLDLGCGPGHDTANLTQAGYEVFGADLSAGMLAQAQIYGQRPLTLADMRTLPFAASSFDAIWMSASLLHVPREDVPAVFVGCRRIVKAGGWLYASIKHGSGQITEEGKWGRTFTLFEIDEIEGFIRAAGFEMREQLTTSTPMQDWLSLYVQTV